MDIEPLLDSMSFDIVDILAVEPGFGGQKFQVNALEKVKQLREWADTHNVDLRLMVDGGINKDTSPLRRAAGGDFLVAGTFLFRHDKSIAEGAKELYTNYEYGVRRLL